jgi:hypothetical protein
MYYDTRVYNFNSTKFTQPINLHEVNYAIVTIYNFRNLGSHSGGHEEF